MPLYADDRLDELELRAEEARAHLLAWRAEDRARVRALRAPWVAEWWRAFYSRNPLVLVLESIVLVYALLGIEISEHGARIQADLTSYGILGAVRLLSHRWLERVMWYCGDGVSRARYARTRWRARYHAMRLRRRLRQWKREGLI